MQLYTIANKNEEKFLRQPVANFSFTKMTPKEIKELVKKMRLVMKKANGIGLSANQVGLPIRIFIARVGNKMYTVFNPRLTKQSRETIALEEGCLSVPGVFGEVARPEKVTLEGQDSAGKKIKIKAWGLLARVFQHEVDHLNGALFIDRAKELYTITPDKQR